MSWGFQEGKQWELSLNGLSLAVKTVLEPQDKELQRGRSWKKPGLPIPGSRRMKVCWVSLTP